MDEIIVINFDETHRGFETIPFEWSLRMPRPPKVGFFSRIIGKRPPEPDPIPLWVCIDKIQVSSSITYDAKTLFAIEYSGTQYIYNNCVKVEMTSYNNSRGEGDDYIYAPFGLKFNKDAITDCSTLSEDKTVKAILKIYRGDCWEGDTPPTKKDLNTFNTVQKTNITIKFRVNPGVPKVEAMLDLNETVEFSRVNPLAPIGQLRINYPKRLSCASQLDTNATLTLFPEKSKNSIAGALICESNAKESANDTIVYDVILDMCKLTNPSEDSKTYEVRGSLGYRIQGSRDAYTAIDLGTTTFELLRDTQMTELTVTLAEGQAAAEDVRLLRNGVPVEVGQMSFRIGCGLTKPYTLQLKNKATDDAISTAGVHIKDLRVSVRINGATLYDADDTEMTDDKLNRLFKVTGEHARALRGGQHIFLPNGIDDASSTLLSLTFEPDGIGDIRWTDRSDYSFAAICHIEFNYYECKDGQPFDETAYKHYSVYLTQPAYIEPNPEWLCVDYGSSAIAAIFGDEVLDLNARKRTVMNADDEYKSRSADTLESKDSKFLPSDILLHNIFKKQAGPGVPEPASSLSTQRRHPGKYSDLAVCLSPTSSMIVEWFQYQVPCLKMLVGRKHLPENNNYNIHYYYKKGDELLHTENGAPRPNETSSLKPVINVLREAYHTLFRYFISPQIEDINRLNRLVLTYPNTYTPRHLSMIREVVRKTFPSIRVDHNCLKFVSESDAVAVYYLSHWHEYHTENANMEDDENILVYDMGAGTLDISYIQKRYVGGKYELTILGKLGTCKAGNYLDFTIADILCNEKVGLPRQLATTEAAPTLINQRIALKLAIKADIKPRLSEEGEDFTINFELGGRQRSVKRDDVIVNTKFENYLNDTTNDMLERLSNYLGGRRLNLNTVLMSGRSCRLRPLQKYLCNALRERGEGSCAFIALDEPVNPREEVRDRQKLAVARGALTLADTYGTANSPVVVKSKRLFANYGIAYQDMHGVWKYMQLLSHKEVPVSSDHSQMTFAQHTIKGLNTATEIKLVQSYLDEERTAQNLNTLDNTDYLSIMSTYQYEDYGHEVGADGTLTVSILLTEDDEVVLRIGALQSQGHNPRATDFEDETTKRSFWPVTITN